MNTDTPKKKNIINRFFDFLWRSLKALNTLFFGLIAVLLITILLSAIISQKGVKIPQGSALILNPAGTLVEQKTYAGAAELMQKDELPQQALVKELLDAIALAKDDKRIGLIVLELDKLEKGLMPKLERIAAAIVDFKSSGKKVIAIADNYSQSALFIAAHADEVLLNPEGMALPYGFSMYSPFFKSFLAKHEVTVNLFKVGKYKSAVDPFLRDNMSAEDREAKLGILDEWWDAYTKGVETARGMTAGSIKAMHQNSPELVKSAKGNLAQLSLDKGFVDRLVTAPERRKYLIELAGENKTKMSYRGVAYKDYLRASPLRSTSPLKQKGNKIAVIEAVGSIVNGVAPSGSIGGKSLSKLIRKARLDDDVKSIVLRIDSGGGSKTASENIRTELAAAQASGIPVVASMGSVAASGGYWIAASADKIWATPTTITGSIGIFGLIPSFEKTLAKYGVYSDGVSTTPIAGGGDVIRGLSPTYSEVLQTVVEAGYQQFLNTVSEGREMNIDAVHEIAQGRIWTGKKAKQLGLVDELGDLEQAIISAAEIADIEDYSVWYVEPELSFEDKLLRELAETAAISLPEMKSGPLSRIKYMIHKELSFVESLNDPNHAYVICSYCPILP